MSLEKFNNLYIIMSEFLTDAVWYDTFTNTLETKHSIKKIDTLNDVFERLIASSKNRSLLKNVLPWPREEPRFDALMFDYDYKKVRMNYMTHTLLNAFKQAFPEKKILKSWEWFANSIIDISTWLYKFPDYNAFREFVLSHKDQPEIVPMLIEKEIRGIWFALACDFLKEAWFDYYAKPDVHIKEILVGISLASEKDSDVQIFKIMTELAKINNVTPFVIDKVMRLIWSWEFVDVKVKKNRKKDFIAYYNKLFI